MRSLWTGSLSFGLVNIPVRLYSATQAHNLDFDLLHKTDFSPVRYAKFCKAEAHEIPSEEIVKGYEYAKGQYVIMSDEDFKKARPEKTGTIDIVAFTLEKDVDTVYFEKPYYIEPDKGAQKAYRLLNQALARSGKIAIARFVMRDREHLAIIKPSGNLLVLNRMRFADEIREPSGLAIPEGPDVNDRELDMALALIDQLTEPFEPDKFHDTYKQELLRVIEEKAEGKEPTVTAAAPKQTAEVKDLMSLLKASLEREIEGREPAPSRRKGTGKSKKRA